MSLDTTNDSIVPLEIHRETSSEGSAVGIALRILWSDGRQSRIPSQLLRQHCPCATCLEQRGDTSHQKPLTGRAASLRIVSSNETEEVDLRSVQAVGNYAISLSWGDGHGSGIYRFSLLRRLAEEHTLLT